MDMPDLYADALAESLLGVDVGGSVRPVADLDYRKSRFDAAPLEAVCAFDQRFSMRLSRRGHPVSLGLCHDS